ncbi:MAG: response regulator [bacterium]
MKKNKKKILILEDEKSLARALELKFMKEGFDVKILHDGEEVPRVLEKEKFSLIISDLFMPKLNGFQVLELAKEIGINIPIVILTNISRAEDEKRAMSLGAKKFFIKTDVPLSKIISYVNEIIL